MEDKILMPVDDPRWGDYDYISLDEITRFTKPLLWRVLVTPLKPRKKIGSIYLPDSTNKTQEYFCHVGLVVALGTKAYTGEYKTTDAPKIGSFVNYGRHCGISEKVIQPSGEEIHFLLLTETDIVGVIDTLEGRTPTV
jgi:hypothetical protein